VAYSLQFDVFKPFFVLKMRFDLAYDVVTYVRMIDDGTQCLLGFCSA
jgi:hypothetical protein